MLDCRPWALIVMNFNQFQLDSPFDRFVESIFHFEGYTPEHSIEKVIPDGSINLIFELDGMVRHVFDNETHQPIADYERVWLSGVQRNYISISAHKNSEMFVIRFNPGGFAPFIDKKVTEFTDRVIPGTQVFGSEIDELRNEILDGAASEDKFKAAFQWVENTFDEKRVPREPIFDSIRKIKEDPQFQQNNLGLLIEESGYSKKQFISLFKQFVGVTPKYFQRIVRFSELLLKIQNEEVISWADISYQCGFYDQAHFIKEFQHFCGHNPKAHLRRSSY